MSSAPANDGAPPDALSRLLDQASITPLHWRIFLLCALVAIMDGFDSVIIGITAPSIARSLSLEISSFGPIFAAAQVGFMAGAFLAGPTADRWGSKLVLSISTLLFAAATLATVRSNSFDMLLLVRFVTGLGLGGAATNLLALCSEFVPGRLRATILAVLWAMIPAGNVVGGLLAAVILPSGWQPLYVIGGAVPALTACAIILLVPESPRFLAAHQQRIPQALRVLEQLVPGRVDTAALANPQFVRPRSASIGALFSGGYALATVWIWLSAFMCWLVLLTILSWMAPLMGQLGLPTSGASLTVSSNSGGAILGALVLGRLMDRYDRYLVCIVSIVIGALAMALTGLVAVSFPALAALSFVLGFTVGGASAGIMAIIATVYPPDVRSTSVGWTIGVARIGSAVGPLVAGKLLQAGATAAEIFELLAVPCLVSAIALLCLRATIARRVA